MISGFSDTERHRDVCRMTCLTCIWRYKNECCSTTARDKKTRFPHARVGNQAISSNARPPHDSARSLHSKVGGNCAGPPKWSDSDAVAHQSSSHVQLSFKLLSSTLSSQHPSCRLLRPRKICPYRARSSPCSSKAFARYE